MYGLIWRVTPGRWPVKILVLAINLFVVLAVLFLWVFPDIAPLVPFNDQTVEQAP